MRVLWIRYENEHHRLHLPTIDQDRMRCEDYLQKPNGEHQLRLFQGVLIQSFLEKCPQQ